MRLGVISDLHYSPRPVPGLAWHGPFDVDGVLPRMRDGLAWFDGQGVDAVAVLGDLSHDGDPESLDLVLTTLAESWAGPTLVVAGNHDTREHRQALSLALERIDLPRLAFAGIAAIELGGFHLGGPHTDVLSVDAPAILLCHEPPLSRRDVFTARGLAYAGDLPDAVRVVAELEARRAPTVVLAGHLHARDDHDHDGRVRQIVVGPLVESPYEVTIFDLHTETGAISVARRVRELSGSVVA